MANIRLGVLDPGPESMLESMLKTDPNEKHSFRNIVETFFKNAFLCPLWRCAEGGA
jgi:hypothetical protein